MTQTLQAAIFMADGLEEIECLTVVDMFRRAEIPIDMVSITDRPEITGAHGIRIATDRVLSEVDFDALGMLILPGGMPGTTHLRDCRQLGTELQRAAADGRYVAAICAAPSVLGGLGILDGKKATCYPGFEDQLLGAETQTTPVVVDGRIITSRGMGTAIDFASALIALVKSPEEARAIEASIQYRV